MTGTLVSQAGALGVLQGLSAVQVAQLPTLLAYGPPATRAARVSQTPILMAISSGETNVTTEVSQALFLACYKDTAPGNDRQQAWTFVLDGHRFYVMPLGQFGDWAYDTTTHEWCQLQTQGFDGMDFTKGVMWGIRVMGGNSIFPYLMEMDPNQPFDEGWRPIERIVTGGIASRARSNVGVANFTLTASVNDDASTDIPISLAFSDDNGATWSPEFEIPLTDKSTQTLIWNALGSFSAPGRIFRITDYAGPVRLDGADVVLNYSSGADSGTDQDAQGH